MTPDAAFGWVVLAVRLSIVTSNDDNNSSDNNGLNLRLLHAGSFGSDLGSSVAVRLPIDSNNNNNNNGLNVR